MERDWSIYLPESLPLNETADLWITILNTTVAITDRARSQAPGDEPLAPHPACHWSEGSRQYAEAGHEW